MKELVHLSIDEYFFNKIRLYTYFDTILFFVKKYIREKSIRKVDVDRKQEVINDNSIFKYDFLHDITKIINLPKTNFENNIEYFKGLIIKLKVKQNIKNVLNSKFEIENILIYKSDSHLDYKQLQYFTGSCDENEIIVKFIEHFLLKKNINLILVIGCDINYKIKEIINSYNIIYFSWLSWKNYQVRIT